MRTFIPFYYITYALAKAAHPVLVPIFDIGRKSWKVWILED